jgi:hypothetical protein
MNNEPIPPTDIDAPPVIPPPVVTPPPRPRPVTPAWVFTLLRTVLATLVVAGLAVGMIFLFRQFGWQGVWKVTLIGTCGLFAVLSILVIVGGALDVRKLFHRLREREASGDSDSTD